MVQRLPAQRPPVEVAVPQTPVARARAAPPAGDDGEEEEPVRAARFDRVNGPRHDDGQRPGGATPLGHLKLAAYGTPDLMPVDARVVLDGMLPRDQDPWPLVARLTAAYEAAGVRVPVDVATDTPRTARMMAALGPAAVPTWLAARAEGRVSSDVVIDALARLQITGAEARVLVAAASAFDDVRLPRLVRTGLARNRALRADDQREHLHALVSDAAPAQVPALAHRPVSTVATLNAGVGHPAAAVRVEVATALAYGTCGFGGVAQPLRARAADTLCKDADVAVRAAAAGLFFQGSPRTAADVAALLRGLKRDGASELLARALASASPDADIVPALNHAATLAGHPAVAFASIRAITASKSLSPTEKTTHLLRVVTIGTPQEVVAALRMIRDAVAQLAAIHPEVCALEGLAAHDVQLARASFLAKALETPPAALLAATEAWTHTDVGRQYAEMLPEQLRVQLIAKADRDTLERLPLPDVLRALLRLGDGGPADYLNQLMRPPHKRPSSESTAELVKAFLVVASDPTLDAASLKVALCEALTLCLTEDNARDMGLLPPAELQFHLMDGAQRVTQRIAGPPPTTTLRPAVLERLVALLGDARLTEQMVSDVLDYVMGHGAPAYEPFVQTAEALGMPAHVVRTFAARCGATVIGPATVAPIPFDADALHAPAELLSPTRAFTALLDARRPQRAALEDTLAAANLTPAHDAFSRTVSVHASAKVAALPDGSAATPSGLAMLLDIADVLSPTVHLSTHAARRLKALLIDPATPPAFAARAALQLLRRTMPDAEPGLLARDALRGTAQATDVAAAVLRARDDLVALDAERIRVAVQLAAERAAGYVDERPMRARAWTSLESLLQLAPYQREWEMQLGYRPALTDGLALFEGFYVFAGKIRHHGDARAALAADAATPLFFFDEPTGRCWQLARAAPVGRALVRPPAELMAQLTGRFPVAPAAPDLIVPAGLTPVEVSLNKKLPPQFVREPQWRDDADHEANEAQQLSIDLQALEDLRSSGVDLNALTLTLFRTLQCDGDVITLQRSGERFTLPDAVGKLDARILVRAGGDAPDKVENYDPDNPMAVASAIAAAAELQIDFAQTGSAVRPLLRLDVTPGLTCEVNLGALDGAARYVLERQRDDGEARAE